MTLATSSARTIEATGATPTNEGVFYRVWAPDVEKLSVIILGDGQERRLSLSKEGEHHQATDLDGKAGNLYWYEFPDGTKRPDPCSRFQPEGVHGPSEVIDPSNFKWSDHAWKRPGPRNHVIYEMHVGTFTPSGTYRAAIDRLDHVVNLGATAIQLMPLADFAGKYNWGYDGVCLFAPSRAYGRPDDLRALVDAAHSRGLAVILDVVYNHVGPQGSVLHDYAPDYFHRESESDWGTNYNLDGERSEPVRAFILQNIRYWLDEYHIDGLRADATHAIPDTSAEHILSAIAAIAHERGAFVIAEDERNPVELLKTKDGTGYNFDGVWSDDFHHVVRVAITGTREAYFASYEGTTEELVKTLNRGWTYCGECYPQWKGKPRGSDCLHLSPYHFVFCIENHDQSGNRAFGERLGHMVSDDQYRAASALLLLSPYTPMLFMGQEWRADTPFMFFSDLSGEDGEKVRERRINEFRKSGLNASVDLDKMPDPQSSATYERSKLVWEEASSARHQGIYALYQQCILWRRKVLVDDAVERQNWKVSSAGQAIIFHYRPPHGSEWLLVVALNGKTELRFEGELAPPSGSLWKPIFHTREGRFSADTPFLPEPAYADREVLHLERPLAIILEASHAS